jgi:5'-nucleotidase
MNFKKTSWCFFQLALILQLSACAGHSLVGMFGTSVPEKAYQSSNPDHITLAVVGINDFHGSLQPRERKMKTARGEVTVKSGGASTLYSMISILRQEMNGRVLVVDAGDEWQGTLESNLTQGSSVVEFFNRLGVKVAAVGNHEFDFQVSNMQKRFAEARYPYVAANIFEKKTGKRPGWKNFYPSRIFEVDGIKIGVIGHSTENTPGTTRYDFVKHLEFREPFPVLENEASELRKQGAGAVLLTTHSGTFCARSRLQDWRLLDSQQDQGGCESDELTRLTAKAKQGVLDGIVSGHTHQVIHHWLNGIPTVQGEAYNQHFNIIYLTFNRRSGRILPQETRIEGLIPICAKMFKGVHHCDVRRLEAGQEPALIDAVFHGQSIVPDQSIEDWIQPILAGTEKYRKEVVAETVLPLVHSMDQESALGNLVADAMKDRSKADFALVNGGGIRTSLDAGPITYDGLFRALPFDNMLNVIRLKGKDVKLMYRIATSGAHGLPSIAGLRLKLRQYDSRLSGSDLDQDGKIDPWEKDRLLEIKTSDGKDLKDDQIYTIATYDYLIGGGDDFHWFMKRVQPSDVSKKDADYCRDVVTGYLKRKKVVNSPDEPLIDPANPRMIIEKRWLIFQ